MAQETTKQENVQAQAPVETPATEATVEQQNAAPAPADQPGAPAQPEKEKKEHPVWDSIKAGAGKVWNFTKKAAPIAGAVVVGVIAGKALGKAEGYENALDKMNPSPDPVPELPGPTEEFGVDTDAQVEDAVSDLDLSDVDTTQF